MSAGVATVAPNVSIALGSNGPARRFEVGIKVEAVFASRRLDIVN